MTSDSTEQRPHAGTAVTGQWMDIEHMATSGNRVQAEVRQGTGPPLVLLPGTWGNAQIRGRLADSLDSNLTLVCGALAGQDDNWPPPSHPSIEQFSRDTLDLADELGLARCFVAGNSLGGMIAIDMLRLCPERILGVISIEGWTHWQVSEDAFRGDTSSTLDDAQRLFLQQTKARLLNRWDPECRAEYGTMWKRWDGEKTLTLTARPVLEIWGDRGRTRPTRAQMRIPEKENIQVEWVSGASHNLLIEAPVKLAALMNRFVEITIASATTQEEP